MLRGLYSAAAGMIAQQRKHDAATSNIANMNTPGFKQNTVVQRSFPEMLISLVRDGEDGQPSRTIGSLHTGVFAEESVPLFAQGDLMQTHLTTDLAILSNIQVEGLAFDMNGRAVNAEGEFVYQPQGFFTVVNANGELRYTRDGRFTVNEAGEWITAGGHRLVGTDGLPIAQGDAAAVRVTPTGLLIDADTGEALLDDDGEPLALLISVIEEPHALIREGEGVFRLDENAAPARPLLPGEGVTVMQGYVERSNVDVAAATVNMMAALRAYEANQRVIQFYDRSLDKAVNDVGRV